MALLLLYVGGRVLDAVWSANSLAVPGEMAIYEATRGESDPNRRFLEERDETRRSIVDHYQSKLIDLKKPSGNLNDIKWDIIQTRNREKRSIDEQFDPLKLNNPDDKRRATRDHDATVDMIFMNASAEWQNYRAVKGIGLFRTLADYELAARAANCHRCFQRPLDRAGGHVR